MHSWVYVLGVLLVLEITEMKRSQNISAPPQLTSSKGGQYQAHTWHMYTCKHTHTTVQIPAMKKIKLSESWAGVGGIIGQRDIHELLYLLLSFFNVWVWARLTNVTTGSVNEISFNQ